jgi:maltose O-acetyltransferase
MIRALASMYNKLTIWKFRRYVVSQVRCGMFLGNNVMVCPGVKFDPPHSFLTSIGNNCVIAPDVRFLNHDASLFIFAGIARIGRINIKDNCFIGAGSTLLPGITIGPNAIVGASSIVTRNVEPDTIVAGNPAKQIKKTSEYVGRSKENVAQNKQPSYNSDFFYKHLGDQNYQNKVKSEMQKSLGYTIGGNDDYTYLFNRVDN